jgi:hypothetical protein
MSRPRVRTTAEHLRAEEIAARYRQRKADLEMVNAKRRETSATPTTATWYRGPARHRPRRAGSAVANLSTPGSTSWPRVASSCRRCSSRRATRTSSEVTASETRRKATWAGGR